MANNRMYLVCNKCCNGNDYLNEDNENFEKCSILLGKTQGAGYYLFNAKKKDRLNEINDFLDKHSFCGKDSEEDEHLFSIKYET